MCICETTTNVLLLKQVYLEVSNLSSEVAPAHTYTARMPCVVFIDLVVDCTFEQDCIGWSNTKTNDVFDWAVTNISTPTGDTGPQQDHTLNNGKGSLMTVFCYHGNIGNSGGPICT